MKSVLGVVLLLVLISGFVTCIRNNHGQLEQVGLLSKNFPVDQFFPFHPQPLKQQMTEEELIKRTGEIKSRFKPLLETKVITPFIIVPSLFGSVIQAKLNHTDNHQWFCPQTWVLEFYLWLDPGSFAPLVVDCWAFNLGLEYDSTTGFNFNRTGVDTLIADWGGTDSIEFLDLVHAVPMWFEIIKGMEALGYVRNQTIFGAPYDWRTSPMNYLPVSDKDKTTTNSDAFFIRFQQLIERVYYLNNSTRVALTSLSAGQNAILMFLSRMVSQEWKEKFIAYYISLDGALSGSVSALHISLSPTYLPAALSLSNSRGLELFQSLGGITALLPNNFVLGKDRNYISTPSGIYGSGNWTQLYSYIGANVAVETYKDISNAGFYEQQMKEPGIEVHLIHGTGVDTPSFLQFNTTDLLFTPNITYANGDGTILEVGLRYLEKYNSTQYPIYSYPVSGMVHGSSLQNKEAQDHFFSILSRHQDKKEKLR